MFVERLLARRTLVLTHDLVDVVRNQFGGFAAALIKAYGKGIVHGVFRNL